MPPVDGPPAEAAMSTDDSTQQHIDSSTAQSALSHQSASPHESTSSQHSIADSPAQSTSPQQSVSPQQSTAGQITALNAAATHQTAFPYQNQQ
jgi:hypothetical protein